MPVFAPQHVIVLVAFISIRTAVTLSATTTGSISATKGANLELHRPVGTDGEGEYSAATKGCFDVIAAATPAVLSSVSEMTLPAVGSRAFTVADYGTADAGTSLGLISKIIDTVRDRGGDKLEVQVHYEDQKDNEWKSVFNHALGHKETSDAYGVVQKPAYTPDNGVFVSASGIGFHNQAYPSSSIDLAVSFTAMHWLSKGPNSLAGQRAMHSARLQNPPVAEMEQASSDWQAIMKARAKELRSGGRMVIVNFCKSKEGYFLGQSSRGASMWDSFETAWARLHADGDIDEDEALGVSFPNYYRTSEECINGIKAIPGLKLLECTERVVPCPYLENWLSGKSTRTPREHAEWFVPTTRTWSESTFKAALKPSRDKDTIMKKFWSNYADIVAEAPEQHHMDYVHVYCTIEKE